MPCARSSIPKFVLTAMPPEMVKGIAEPVLTYAVREARG
jgi:hypothetical protein